MVSKSSLIVARAMWVLPVLVLALAVNQVDVAIDLHRTLTQGRPAVAEVVGFESSGRVDVTYDYVSLRVPLGDGTVLEQEKMSLPHSFVPEVQGKATLDVRVLPGSDQPIVIAPLGRAQWRIAAANAAMSTVGFVLLFVGIFAWNRYLRRKGDPSLRSAEDVMPHRPAYDTSL